MPAMLKTRRLYVWGVAWGSTEVSTLEYWGSSGAPRAAYHLIIPHLGLGHHVEIAALYTRRFGGPELGYRLPS